MHNRYVIKYSRFDEYNLPNLMIRVGNWIKTKEIKVSNILIYALNDGGTLWVITVYYYVREEIK